ncbi:MAG: hypothetical protein COU31_03405 [Candidatus Magasanikbacteria bacterium CG10_big_fil_rev_8_21_14_0_10_40_10]|uniref:Predicted 3'-5' exonuclease PolB-like domain-containing protein n=1 Tax=Candidatus Magasanikbacteria bacterium CG10_big_fil_rev_8_21_14_0_10_40_10 TaxID=1974648 RepID=A0A2M6W3S2_9BACT|nr:MAG: hypothetical protein COU31_03405 [Candidatus Magasanikbacteria bacterium CG10_big_fil_rev_8_21_14_0_10_40_10]
MSALIFDIETIGEDFDQMDKTTQTSLTRWIDRSARDEKEAQKMTAEIKNGLGLSPLTGQIVALGVMDSDKSTGAVYYSANGDNDKIQEIEERGCKLKALKEAEMLAKFWELVEKYEYFVSFNGRGFDVPFIMMRSAVHNIRPSKDLMSNRYLSSQRFGAKHIDLMDQLGFYGASARKGNLHLFCRAFGIDSPKDGVCGSEVGQLYAEGKFLDIAKYNVGDLVATNELYKHWTKYLQF